MIADLTCVSCGDMITIEEAQYCMICDETICEHCSCRKEGVCDACRSDGQLASLVANELKGETE